jgi:hypothetical protein
VYEVGERRDRTGVGLRHEQVREGEHRPAAVGGRRGARPVGVVDCGDREPEGAGPGGDAGLEWRLVERVRDDVGGGGREPPGDGQRDLRRVGCVVRMVPAAVSSGDRGIPRRAVSSAAVKGES